MGSPHFSIGPWWALLSLIFVSWVPASVTIYRETNNRNSDCYSHSFLPVTVTAKIFVRWERANPVRGAHYGGKDRLQNKNANIKMSIDYWVEVRAVPLSESQTLIGVSHFPPQSICDIICKLCLTPFFVWNNTVKIFRYITQQKTNEDDVLPRHLYPTAPRTGNG